MKFSFTFIESSKWNGVIHWRCEFAQTSRVLWIPVPYDDLLLDLSNSTNLAIMRRPSSRTESIVYKTGTVLFGTRMPLSMFLGLFSDKQSNLRDYEACNIGSKKLVNYAQNTDQFLAGHLQSIDSFIDVSERTQRRKVKDTTGINSTQLETLISMHDFLSTACDYGTKSVTLTNSIDQQKYYDQPHFGRKFKRLFGASPTDIFASFEGLPEQLLTISYKYMPDFHGIINKLEVKERFDELQEVKKPSSE